MHPWLQSIADSTGCEIRGSGPGPNDLGTSREQEARRERDELLRPFRMGLNTNRPMTAADVREFQRIKFGHQFEPVWKMCECGMTEKTYHLHGDITDIPMCEIAFPQTSGCSIRTWNQLAESMTDDQRRRGFLSVVRAPRAPMTIEEPDAPEPPEPERPRRKILHDDAQ